MAIPTKKKKGAKIDTERGQIAAGKLPGYFQSGFDVRIESPLGSKSKSGEITIPAFPQERRLVCRALVKMALGALADGKSDDIFATQFNDARKFSRFNDPKIGWWYLEKVNSKELKAALSLGAIARKEPVKLEIVYLDGTATFFHLKYFFLKMTTPILSNCEIDLPQELPDGLRMYRV